VIDLRADFLALTHGSHTGRLNRLVTDAGVSIPWDPGQGGQQPTIVQTRALWDTGASGSVITEGLASQLGLAQAGVARVAFGDGPVDKPSYLANIYLPNAVAFPMLRIIECADTAGAFGLIVGMDIIGAGDFAITNVGGVTKMSYRFPSIQTIDYVEESRLIRRINDANPGRNDDCPCGSGSKFKFCHGRGRTGRLD